jgi:hypothetical protein
MAAVPANPDGKISDWLWTKISGPVSFKTISKADVQKLAKDFEKL